MPDVVKNLLIINGLMFLATYALPALGIVDLTEKLALYSIFSEAFKPYQLITHMFMHGGIGHIFFNMFALWMFGSALENVWGPKRFLIFYLVTGLGAAILHLAVGSIDIIRLQNEISAAGADVGQVKQAIFDRIDGFQDIIHSSVVNEVIYSVANQYNLNSQLLADLIPKYYIPTVGASGAVFGLLLGFGMLFPNSQIYLYFLFPIKAKYFVILYGALELYLGIANNPGDNIAHFAHLGGMVFGFIMIKIWKR